MDAIKGLLFDIGGVLYVGNTPIEGAPQTVKELMTRYPMRFLTNTTRTTPQTIYENLSKMGFAIAPESLFTALDATKSYIREREGTAYTVLTDEAERYFEELRSENPDFVVVGDAHTNFTYARMNGAFRALQKGAKLVAAAKNRYFKDDDGALSMDAGGFIAALEFAAGVEATLIGKPSRDFFTLAASSMGLNPGEVLMVGDDIESDIKGAQDAGMKAVLVKTGKYREGDLDRGIVPDGVLESVAQLPKWLERASFKD